VGEEMQGGVELRVKNRDATGDRYCGGFGGRQRRPLMKL